MSQSLSQYVLERLECRQLLASVPAGFTTTQLATGLDGPTALQLLPDGRAIILQQDGDVRLFKDGQLLEDPILSLSVNSSGERGLLGIAADPAFATNGYIYLYYTVPGASPFNRVSRFTLSGDTIDSTTEAVLFEQPALSSATNHNGGAMHFAKDGKLLIAVGDNAQSAMSQSTDSVLGKILRINSDGTIPTDNPFINATTGINQAIYAIGFRNPFTFDVDQASGRIFVNDVGQSSQEEIDELFAGANYGWPNSEGPNTDEGITGPIHSYGRDVGFAIVGGAFYSPDTVKFPASFVGDYFFADFAAGFIKRLDSQTLQVSSFGDDFGSIVDLDVTPQGELLVLSRSSGGSITQISTASGIATISKQPQQVTVGPGATASFRVSARSKSSLTYQWLRNGEAINTADNPTATTANLRIVASAADNGATYSVQVTNIGGTITSDEATLTVTANRPAVVKLSAPAATFKYTAGKTLKVGATATDPDTGKLPISSLSYLLESVDGETVNTVATATGKSAKFILPSPGDATTLSLQYRVTITATDSVGEVTTVARTYDPKLITLRVQPTLPRSTTGVPTYVVDGTDISPTAGLLEVTSIAGVARIIRLVDSPQDDIALRKFPGAIGDTLTIAATSNRTIKPTFSAVVVE